MALKARTSVLDRIMIAAPCNVSWQDMEGNERVRFCGQCRLNVYNTSLMSRQEIEELLFREEKTPCLRIFRRADGTLITKDCPVGLRRIRDRFRKLAQAVAALWTLFVSGVEVRAQTAEPSGLIPGRDFNGSPVPLSSFDLLMSTESPGGVQVVGEADYSALNFYKRACLTVHEKQYEQTDKLFSQCLLALRCGKQDPKFIESVYRDFARYLRSRHNAQEAKKVLGELDLVLAQFKTAGTEPVCLIPSSVAMEHLGLVRRRRTKVSPSLPEGFPVPDNE